MDLRALLAATAAGLAVLAAIRSTWSPCGLSMLSSITPLGEAGRGHRFAPTATWFVVGAVVGGACTGGVMALGAWLVAALAPPAAVLAAVFSALCLLAVAADTGLLGVEVPLLRRQVNECWLDRFRSAVYGAGFGWQIGSGFATYIMTALVVALVPLAALSASPLAALGIGVLFGLTRGSMVLLGRRVTDVASLQGVHRRLDALRVPVQWAVWSAALLAALGVAAAALPAVVVLAVLLVGAGLGARCRVVSGRLAPQGSLSRKRSSRQTSRHAHQVGAAAEAGPERRVPARSARR